MPLNPTVLSFEIGLTNLWHKLRLQRIYRDGRGTCKRYALKLTEKGEPPFNTTTASKWEHLQYNTPSLPPLFPTWQQGIFSPFLFSRAPEKGGKWMLNLSWKLLSWKVGDLCALMHLWVNGIHFKQIYWSGIFMQGLHFGMISWTWWHVMWKIQYFLTNWYNITMKRDIWPSCDLWKPEMHQDWRN